MVLWFFGPFFEVAMLVLHSSWRYLAALAALGMLSIAVGCGGKTPVSTATPSYTVSGSVKYKRIPLLKDADGKPIGLETDPAKFIEMPARGVFVRAIHGKNEIDSTGQTVVAWKNVASTLTDSSGNYTFTIKGESLAYIEVMSSMQFSTSNPVRVVAADIGSSAPILDRSVYTLRKGADGSSPAGNPVPGAIITANATVDFMVELDSPWWISPLSPSLAVNATLEPTGSGSRILSLLDSAYAFSSYYGNATPGYTLNLHYLAGTAWSFGSRPSFVEYDRGLYPASFNGNAFEYLGAIRAAPGLDDTWNESALYSLFARNWLVSQGISKVLPTQGRADGTDLQDLAPEMAVLEGFVPAIAASLLKSPYLAPELSPVPTVRDIRDRTGLGSDAYSAANIAALAWEVILKANSVVAPGTPTEWAKMEPLASSRFFAAMLPLDASGNPADSVSIYNQITRLKEAKAGSDLVDLAAIFTDAKLTTLLAPFNISWPRPTTGPEASFLVDWGTDPNSLSTALPTFTFSMADAHLNALGVYPNCSKGEVFRGRFLLTRDRKYKLSVRNPELIPSGAKIEVILGGNTFQFTSIAASANEITLLGNSSKPVYHPVHARLVSPSVKLPDPVPVTLQLDAQN